MRLMITVLAMLLASPAMAQEQKSFAAALAPEQAFETCFAADVPTAVACALDKCKAQGAVDCVITSACTSGWAGAMGVTTGEIHWTETVCGAPDKQAAIAALTAFCKGGLPHVRECYLSTVWSPEGVETPLETTLDPKALK